MQGQGQPLSTFFGQRLRRAEQELAALDADTVLIENEDVLVAQLLDGCVPTPVAVDWASTTSSGVTEATTKVEDAFHRGRAFDVPASRIMLSAPVLGTWEMLAYDASTSSWAPLDLILKNGTVVIEVVDRDLTKAKIDAALEQVRNAIDQRASWANKDLASFALSAEQTLRNKLATRRQRLLGDRALEASLTIPMQRTNQPAPPVAAARRVISLQTRRAQASFVPEPVLESAIYEDVLQMVGSWARQLERTPGTLAKLGEEELRDLLLGTLNSYWQGAAGGEMFNGSGKTDILIREGDRNVFIAECKIWDGPKAAGEAVDQLLGYLVWRDSKAALIMFIGTKNPAETIGRLVAAVMQHRNFVLTKDVANPHEQSRFLFTADDEGRRFDLTVLPVVVGVR